MESTTIEYFERFKKLVFLLRLKVALPSTTIKLEIAFTKVSTVLIVNDNPSITNVNPLGVKGAGEIGTGCAVATFVNALVDALSPMI